MGRSDNAVVLYIDQTRSIHAAAGSDVISHCAEGTGLWPDDRAAAKAQGREALQFCLAADKASRDPLYEGDLFEMLGVKSWEGIANYGAAARFTEDLVSLEALLGGRSSACNSLKNRSAHGGGNIDLKNILARYASAIAARKKMSVAPAESRRWNDVQIALFHRLRRDCVGDEMPPSLDHPDEGKKEDIERFAELYHEADGPQEIEQSLFRLRWLFASSAERAGLCTTAECRDGYELKSEQELETLARRPTLTSRIFFPEPTRKKRLFGAGFGLGATIIHGREPIPEVDLWLIAQAASIVRFTAAASARQDVDDRTTSVVPGVASYGRMRSGISVAAVGIASVMPWGEAFSLDAGGGVRWFDGTVTEYFSPEGQWQKYLQRKRAVVSSTEVVDLGVTVFPREWLRMRMSAVMALDDPHDASFGVTLGLNHWLL